MLVFLIILPIVIGAYAYAAYPLIIAALAARRSSRTSGGHEEEWPFITITMPCYNEAATIDATLSAVLALDYPEDRRQVVVISDASNDGTDDIVRGFADRGVELLRLAQRRGKSAAENAAAEVLRGDIVVNVDATVRLAPNALKALVSAFDDPTVGTASGRDVSVPAGSPQMAVGRPTGESGYVDYEMKIRSYETQLDSIVGSSGCFYGIRASLYDGSFPESLSRDFASALIAREHGFRAVSVEDAICYVPRTGRLDKEFQRKTRTMARGLSTLFYKRHLLNPFRYGVFAWLLFSHKVCRWLVYPLLIPAAVALLAASFSSRIFLNIAATLTVGLTLGVAGMMWTRRSASAPSFIAIPGFVVASNLAGLLAWKRFLMGERLALWEPTRRTAATPATSLPG